MKNEIYTVIKGKSNIKGFWLDNGKIYIDSIKKVDYSENVKNKLFNDNELAVFYCNDREAIIEDKNGLKTVLRNKRFIHYKRLSASLIRGLLRDFNGFTVYRNKTFNDFTIEIWQ